MSKMLGKYEILRTLGKGAMGEVYLAHHPAIGREVAIKTILPSAAKGEDAEGRFRREAEAAGKLSHPNLVTIFDFDKDEEVLFLVMEFVKGDDLEDLIRQDALSHSEFLEVLAQVCDGLSHAHRNGIIHRDIKPSNVRIVRDGKHLQAKVMDFGIARMEDSNMTATGIVMGTVSYMAPEYIREGHATSQSDLFAVGVMLYECLTGSKPFAGDNTTTILFKIVSNPAPPIDASLLHGISPSIREVLDKALAKEPSARFQTADDLAKALRACKDPTWAGSLEGTMAMLAKHASVAPDTAGTQVLRPAAPTAQVAVQDAPAKGRGGLYAAAGAAVLLLGGVGAYVATRSKGEAPPQVPTVAQAAAGQTPAQAPAPAAGQNPGQVPVPAPGQNPGQAPVQPAPSPRPAPSPAAEAVKVAPKDAPSPKPEPPKPVASKPEPPKPEPPKPEPPKVDPAQQAVALIATDPRQAAALLKPLVQASPASVELNANYLAALYRARNAWDFDRGLTHAAAAGVTAKSMINVPAFKSAMKEESNLYKAKKGVLPSDVMEKVLAGL